MNHDPYRWLLAACIGRFGNGLVRGAAHPRLGGFIVEAEANGKHYGVAGSWLSLRHGDAASTLSYHVQEAVRRVS